MKKLLTLLFFIVTFSCQQQKELRKITEKFNRFEGSWSIQTDLSKVPDSLAIKELKGTLTFLKCKANKVALKDNNGSQGCIGSALFGNIEFVMNILHNKDNTEQIRLNFGKFGTDYSVLDLRQIKILTGNWKIVEKTDKYFKLSKLPSDIPKIPTFEAVITGEFK